jgi:hypothetical protein
MWSYCKGQGALNFKNGMTNLKNLLNFRLSSWGPIKVGALGNLLPSLPPPPLGAALTWIYEYACMNRAITVTLIQLKASQIRVLKTSETL